MGGLKIISLNFSRISSCDRILDIMERLKPFKIDIYCIQEINVFSAVKIFQNYFQVITNWDLEAKSNIGIVTLIPKNLKIYDKIMAQNGRIIGLKLDNLQIWNVYPQSGSEFRKAREVFF